MLGAALVEAFVSRGDEVVVADRIAGVSDTPGVTQEAVDLTAPDQVEALWDRLERRPRWVVNAAGLLSTGPFADLPASEWDRVARVNVAGILNCVKAAMPAVTRQRAGRIINIASVSAMRGGGSLGNTIYGATKASVVALTMGLARELGPLGITVNAVAPAVADTAMTRAALTDDMRRRIVARLDDGRLYPQKVFVSVAPSGS